MNLIGCPDTATSGTYVLNGTNASDMDDNELAEVRNRRSGLCSRPSTCCPGERANVEPP
jgi:putative ABC transport system ATP-binding protein